MASTDVNTDVTTVTFGSGVNEFTLSLIGDEIDKKTNNITKWKSKIYVDNAVTSFEMENLNNFFIKGESDNLSDVNNENCPLSINADNTFSIHNGSVKKQFGKTVWLYSDNVGITHVVNDVSNIKRLVWKPYVSTQTFTDVDGKTVTTYLIQLENSQPYVKIRNIYDTGDVETINLMPFIISENSEYVSETIKDSRYEIGLFSNKCYRYGTCKNKNVFPQNSGGESNYLPTFPENVNLPSGNNVKQKYISKDGNYLLNFEYNTINYHGMTFKIYIASETELLRTLANFGLAFEYSGKRYYPVFENGVITGYTENINDTKDWYDWIGIKDHENADTPSSGGDEDELDDSEMTLNANGNSFIKWFAVTGQNLLSLIDSFNSETVPAGFVPLDHIVGVYQAPFNIPDFSNCGSLTNIFVGKYDTNVQGMPLLNQGSYSTTGIIASKYIEPIHNNFLDYEPYTSLSLYLPFCGSCNLDANLFVGKTVNVIYYFDIFSGDVIANVYANGTLYKTLSGNFTISQPITSQNVGLQKDTVIKGAVGVATNMLGTAGFAMSGNISGALSGAVGATISSISTYTHLNGISPVATKGGGGRSIFYTCKNIILYKSTAIENHGAYEKYRGKVCNYDSKLSECHGYTVVDNPHIEIKCTNTEKDEIKKLLEEGVILP